MALAQLVSIGLGAIPRRQSRKTDMSENKRFRFEFLDALRGVAILMVVLLHFTERGTSSDDQLIHACVWPVLQHGYLGVQLFFVVSGYCISAALYNALDRSQTSLQFLKRRAWRIFPPYWASMLLVVLLGLITMSLLGTPRATVFPLAVWEWAANLLLVQGPLKAHDANLVYWSLSIEIQFYLVMAIGMLFGKRWTEIWVVILSIVSMALLTTHAVSLTGWVLNYWLEFACGIAAFYWITGCHRYTATPWLLTGAAFLTGMGNLMEHELLLAPAGRFNLGVKLLFCLATTALLVRTQPFDEKLMARRACRWLAAAGTISYSLYLTHVPIGTRVFNLGARLTGLSGLRWLLYFTIAMAAAITFGALFFHFCERPWLNSRRQPSEAVPNRMTAIAEAAAN